MILFLISGFFLSAILNLTNLENLEEASLEEFNNFKSYFKNSLVFSYYLLKSILVNLFKKTLELIEWLITKTLEFYHNLDLIKIIFNVLDGQIKNSESNLKEVSAKVVKDLLDKPKAPSISIKPKDKLALEEVTPPPALVETNIVPVRRRAPLKLLLSEPKESSPKTDPSHKANCKDSSCRHSG